MLIGCFQHIRLRQSLVAGGGKTPLVCRKPTTKPPTWPTLPPPFTDGTMKVSLTTTTPAAADLRGGRFFSVGLSGLRRRPRDNGLKTRRSGLAGAALDIAGTPEYPSGDPTSCPNNAFRRAVPPEPRRTRHRRPVAPTLQNAGHTRRHRPRDHWNQRGLCPHPVRR